MSRGACSRAGTSGLGAGGVALALVVVASLGSVACGERGPRKNILLIVADTVRADRLSSYGYDRPTTPNIDALAAAGIRYANASSTSGWTVPSHASLFTGLMPIVHGATQEHWELAAEFATLAELLGAAGYETIGASGNPLVSRRTGIARGFDHFEMTSDPLEPGAIASHPNVTALQSFWGERSGAQPFFAFVNFIEAHSPYDPPPPFRRRFLSRSHNARLASLLNRGGIAAYYGGALTVGGAAFAELSDLYDGELAYVDALIGHLLEELDRAGLANDTIVIFASDHGENIGDHGHFGHLFSLYASTVKIPLIIRLPGFLRAGEVRAEAVSLADVFTTILELARVDDPPAEVAGRDLLAPDLKDDVPVFAEYYYPLQALASVLRREEAGPERLKQFRRRLRSVEKRGMRMVWSSSGETELYDLAVDPGELEDLGGSPHYAELEDQLAGLLEEFVAAGDVEPIPDGSSSAGAAEASFGEFDEASRERLRELGYVQ